MKRASCIVIGGGLVGLSAAFRLMRRGASVRLLAAGRPYASLAAAGMLPPFIEAFDAQNADPAAPPRFAELLFAAARRWPDFANELGREDGGGAGYRALGTFIAAYDDAGAARLAQMAEAATSLNVEVEALDAEAALRLEPGLSPSVLGGLHIAADAVVEPPLVIRALRGALLRGGAEVLEGRAVRLEPKPGGACVVLRDGLILEADAVLIATGWPGAELLAPELAHVFPIKGQIVTVSARDGPLRMMRGQGIYLAPRGDGRLEIGATSEPGVETLHIDPESILGLRERAAALAPALARAPAIASRAGIRPGSPDHAPLLGRSSLGEGVFLAAGVHRNGVLLAPLLADILAGAILDGVDSAGWLQSFTATRFDV